MSLPQPPLAVERGGWGTLLIREHTYVHEETHLGARREDYYIHKGKVYMQNQTSDLPKLAAPARRALSGAGISTLEELSTKPLAEIEELHGIGPNALAQLRQALADAGLAFADELPADVAPGEYAEVNGLRLYYEISGQGEPLILLHGGLGSTEMMRELTAVFAKERRVIAVDLQGHGRTADIDRPIRYELMGDDIAALIRHLGLEQADVMGYSLGGGVALRTAIQHPEIVRKLVVVSTAFRQAGWFPEVREGMRGLNAAAAEHMQESAIYQSYVRIAPEPENFPGLLDKMGDLFHQENDWSNDVPELSMPVMLVFGDADSMPPSHIAEFFALLGGGQRDASWDGSGMTQHRLAILPGTTHYNIFSSPLLPTVVAPFLASSESGLKNWGE